MKYFNYIFILAVFLISCTNKSTEKQEVNTTQTDLISEKLDTLLNHSEYVVIGNTGAEVKIISITDSLKYPQFTTIAKENDILIVAKNLDESNVELFKKFDLKYDFASFSEKIYEGPLAAPNFATNPTAKEFSTRIKEGCKNGINFSGKYTLVTWGCGTSCQSGVIVDRSNGTIYDGYFSSYGAEFRKDSRMIIVNSGLIDPKTKLLDFQNMVDIRVELWTGTTFVPME